MAKGKSAAYPTIDEYSGIVKDTSKAKATLSQSGYTTDYADRYGTEWSNDSGISIQLSIDGRIQITVFLPKPLLDDVIDVFNLSGSQGYANYNSFQVNDKEREAIRAYKTNGYHEINYRLRANKNDASSDLIDRILFESTIGFNGWIFRAVNISPGNVGDVLTDQAFTSWTASGDVAKQLVNAITHKTILAKKVQQNEHGLRIDRFVQISEGCEYEVLLPRNTKFTVSSSIELSDGLTLVTVI